METRDVQSDRDNAFSPGLPEDSNPFATRWVRPGAIPYEFPTEQTAAQIVARLESCGWWGQIWGDHGTGKSTLLQTLVPLLLTSSRKVAWGELHAGQRQPIWRQGKTADWDPHTQVILDGFEQLSRWSRWRWMRRCRRAGAGLLVTTHQDMGLPTLARTEVSLELTQRLAASLTSRAPLQLSAEDVRQCWLGHPGNLREVLFALYDRYELRRRQTKDLT